jgi:outer membrane protein assembly factor BamB
MTPSYETQDWQDLGPAALDLADVRSLVRETVLIGEEGSPAFVIVPPDDPSYHDLAYGLQEAILGSLNGPERVRTGAEVALDRPGPTHVIALGSIANNPLLGELYHSYYVAVDRAYPGTGGHVLQTVYDPWGAGGNVVVCGGSELSGVRTAVEKAIGRLQVQGSLRQFPRLHDIEIGGEFRERYPSTSLACTPEHRRWMVAHAYQRLEQGMHRGATPTVSHAGIMYHLTGDDRFAELYRDLFKIMYQAAVNDPGTGPWSPWGFDADFQSATMLQAWDLVEEAPALTPEDRLYITNHLLWYVRYMAEHARAHRPADPRTPRHNHYTFAALGLLHGAKYFAKYYHLTEAEEWLALADECFRVQAEAFKANEDCNSYQWLTFYHTLKYAFVRPDPAYLESGMARLCLDLGLATMDNLGYQVPYGDVADYRGTFSEVPYYRAAAWALRDPAYQPVLDRKALLKPEHDLDGIQPVGYQYETDLGEGRAWNRYLGVSVLPLEPLYYRHFEGEKHIDPEMAFDKVVFRHSLDPQDDYLMLDGLSNGGHYHHDGNSIVRYTSKGRIWLADADYLKSPIKFHNSLLVFRDGRGELIPPYTELEEACWLEPFGYSRTTVRDYCGTDWTRHVLELRGQWFLVLDQVVARSGGDYHLRCLWRTIGDVSLDVPDRRLVVDQGGPRMELTCAPGCSADAQLTLKSEAMIRGTWDQYPYNGGSGEVKVLQECASLRLAAGDRYVYCNVFGAHDPVPPAQRLAEELVRLVGDPPALVGSGDGLAAVVRSLVTDARFLYISSERVLLAGVSTLFIDGAERMRSGRTVALSLDLARRCATAMVPEPTEVRLGGAAADSTVLVAGTHRLPLSWAAEVEMAVEAALSTSPGPKTVPSPPQVVSSEMRRISEPLWDLRLPAGQMPYSACLGSEREGEDVPLYVGTLSGSLYCVENGRVEWDYRSQGRVYSIAVADLTGDGRPVVVLGSADHYLYTLDRNGREIWRRELTYYLHEPLVRVVTTADLGLAEGRAIVAGGKNCHVLAYSPDGCELWRHEVIHGVKDIAAIDMTGDGRDEVLAVTDWSTYQCIDASGQGLWPVWEVRSRHGRGTNVVRGADIDGDGLPEMLCGAVDSCVYAFRTTGEMLWEFYTGEEIAALAAVDLNGDGAAEVVAGAMNGYVYALDGSGGEIWNRFVGEEVNSVIAVSSQGTCHLVVGTDGPSAYVLDRAGAIVAAVKTADPLRKVLARPAAGGVCLYAVSRNGHVAGYQVSL